jgi:hypothetical protein
MKEVQAQMGKDGFVVKFMQGWWPDIVQPKAPRPRRALQVAIHCLLLQGVERPRAFLLDLELVRRVRAMEESGAGYGRGKYGGGDSLVLEGHRP